MRRLLAAALLALAAVPAYGQGLSLSGFSATGTVYMQVRITAVPEQRNDNTQINIWASSDWTDPGATGSIEEGSFTFEDPNSAGTDINIRRFARWGTGNRLIFNTTGTGNIGALFDSSADPYNLTIIRNVNGVPAMITVRGPSTGGGTGFVDWRQTDGDLTLAEYNFITGISTNDEVIIAIHQGSASYSAMTTRKEYIGGIEIIKEYVGDIEIVREYVGAVRIY